MMELKNYDILNKFIIPLLDDNINNEDVSLNSGFVGIYTEDKNRPYLDDHIFLLYDSEVNTIESFNRFTKFNQLDTLYNKKYMKIKNHHYILYAFTKANNSNINKILNGGIVFDSKSKYNIYSFWNDLDFSMITHLFNPLNENIQKLQATVPEEDYYPSVLDAIAD